MTKSDPFQLSFHENLLLDEFINYGVDLDDFINQSDLFSPPFTTTDDSLDTSHANFSSFSDIDIGDFPFHFNELQFRLPVNDSSLDHFEDLDSYSITEMEEIFDVTSAILPALNLPREDMKIENQLSANHLAKAYAEAMANQQRELAEPLDKEQAENYLKQECSEVFGSAFQAIYHMLPNGMFAHFGANSAILAAIPYDVQVLHIVDFDMGAGIQWCTMIMSIAQQQNGMIFQQITFKLTSIKWKEEDNYDHEWRFEETKNRLHDYAYSHGLKLKVEEKELQDLAIEMRKTKKNREGKREWLAFNCMHALPHMGRRRNRRNVMEFLSVAKEYLQANSSNTKTSNNNRGIITYGDGENWDKIRNCSGFGSFYDSSMDYYQALLESMEWNFPTRLEKARMAMECLFVGPFVSSLALFEEWNQMKEVGDSFLTGFGLQEARFSNESLMEAKVMVREGKCLYSVRTEGENENVMVLEWNGTPLVRISAWR
ncbi:nodulation-signaling pathway 2 protein-like [Melia azedarach]|uniref:Nodulation-signaling pathway 2 protein-like n=1 Tax=Melia azedarach TaxID=155640 RepID=A0ACC1WZN2_MELAZ|nr:nodulation-signaling pathway 2 protein-like [Melia azedarach]